MTKNTTNKRRRLSHELLGMIGICALVSIILCLLLINIATTIAESYCFDHDIPMTEFDWMEVDRWIFSASALISVCSFTVMFLSLFNDRITYIKKLTKGIDALSDGKEDLVLPLEGNNELTDLASAINSMSATRKQLRQKEQSLANEKEQLIRALSHDIRTPLTSILAYSDYLTNNDGIEEKEQKEYLQLIQKKSLQIKDLTSILLDGSKRNTEHFEDGKLLFEQIAAEFESELEDQFDLQTDFSSCPSFSGSFDVQELRRIFDNLSSNIAKYADANMPVSLSISLKGTDLVINQTNSALSKKTSSDGYQIGLNSIRRIAQLYGGKVDVELKDNFFSISITLSEF